ncbi:MAG: hypothetical protein LBR44_07310 [Clostridiales Family XIII bacterium]|nr:hypothetical protein [Clostridiales Family XIII bacterium]
MQDFNGIVQFIEAYWGVLVVFVSIISIIIWLFRFQTRVNKSTNKKIERLSSSGKYLRNVFVELNESKEFLRYFIYGNKWIHRLRHDYNALLYKYRDIPAESELSKHISLKIRSNATRNQLGAVITTAAEYYNRIYGMKAIEEYSQFHGDAMYKFESAAYSLAGAIVKLQMSFEISQAQGLLLIGSAGNGKTNLLCSIAETATNNKMPCIWIDSRDIKGNCYEHIIKQLELPKIFVKTPFVYLRLTSVILGIQRKKMIIIIDALNENDNSSFIASIGELFDELADYSNIKILCSCRSEYFDSRFSIMFDSVLSKPFVLGIQESHYSKRVRKLLLSNYSKHFNMTGSLSSGVQEKLLRSLLLMRIFFEINSDSGANTIELRNAELFKKYIQRINQLFPQPSLLTVLNSIADIMLRNQNYESVDICALGLDAKDTASFKNMLDNNLIISRNIEKGHGLTQEEIEVVEFVFDEFRDFCLAKCLLAKDEDAQDCTYGEFYKTASRMFAAKESPLEGLLKYAYYHFKNSTLKNKETLCFRILSCFGHEPIQGIGNKPMPPYQGRVFQDYGVLLAFSDSDSLSDFEIDYIAETIQRQPHDFWQLVVFLLRNEYQGHGLSLDYANTILLKIDNYQALQEVIKYPLGRRFDGTRKAFDALIEAIHAFLRRDKMLPANLQRFVIIIAIIQPDDLAIKKVADTISKVTFVELMGQVSNNDLRNAIAQYLQNITIDKSTSLALKLERWTIGGDLDADY